MARTPSKAWPAAENFGVRDLLEMSRQRPDYLDKARDVMNRAFQELGLADYKLLEIRYEAMAQDRDQFTLTFADVPGLGKCQFPVTI